MSKFIAAAALVASLAAAPAAFAGDWSLAIHGGAGVINRGDLSPEKDKAYRAGLDAALKAGSEVLEKGGSSLDAVEAAVKLLEECPLFNAGIGAVLGLAAAGLAAWRKPGWAAATGFVTAAGFYALLMWGVAPRLPDLWVSPRAAALALKDAQTGDPPPILVGYQEPSLVFALGSDTQLLSPRAAAEAGVAAGGLALVEDREKPAFLARIAELQADVQPVDALDGFNYSRGRKVHITLYRTQPQDAGARPKVE